MKIFIEIETHLLHQITGGQKHITAIEEMLDEAKAEVMRDLREGGLYLEGTADYTVELESASDLPKGRVLISTNNDLKISD